MQLNFSLTGENTKEEENSEESEPSANIAVKAGICWSEDKVTQQDSHRLIRSAGTTFFAIKSSCWPKLEKFQHQTQTKEEKRKIVPSMWVRWFKLFRLSFKKNNNKTYKNAKHAGFEMKGRDEGFSRKQCIIIPGWPAKALFYHRTPVAHKKNRNWTKELESWIEL